MGKSRSRSHLERLTREQPRCIFCGGTRAAETVDHCPPRALFAGNLWPSGYTFGACKACNHGSRHVDLIFSMLSRLDPLDQLDSSEQARASKHVDAVSSQYARLVRLLLTVPASAKRRIAREMQMVLKPGETYAELGIASFPEPLQRVVGVFAAKLGKALYFHHTRRIVPTDGKIAIRWTTIADMWLGSTWFPAVIDKLQGKPTIAKGRIDLSDQFAYRYTVEDDERAALFAVSFRGNMGLLIYIAANPRAWDEVVERYQARQGEREHPLMLAEYPADMGFLEQFTRGMGPVVPMSYHVAGLQTGTLWPVAFKPASLHVSFDQPHSGAQHAPL